MFILCEAEATTIAEIVALCISSLTAIILGYQKLKKPESDAEMKLAVKTEIKEEVDPEIEKLTASLKELGDKMIEADKSSSIMGDRVKAIFKKMGEISTETISQLDKVEAGLKDDIKEVKEDCKERDKDVRAQMKDLWEKKKDKSA